MPDVPPESPEGGTPPAEESASDPPFADPGDVPSAIAQLGRIGGAVDKEFTLVSDRMTWMVIAESFIFAAFATSATAWTQAKEMRLVATFMLFLMPVLGIFLAGIVIPAINAAHRAAQRLKDQRDRMEQRLPERFRIATVSSKDREHREGNLPPYLVPPFIMVVWIILLTVVICALVQASGRA
jgi:hypothetical protein